MAEWRIEHRRRRNRRCGLLALLWGPEALPFVMDMVMFFGEGVPMSVKYGTNACTIVNLQLEV